MTREEAIKIVKSNWPEGRHQIKEALETLIPELTESEDEKIRKFIVETIFRYYGNSQEYLDTLAYLERQKEQKPIEWSEEDERMLAQVEYAMKAAYSIPRNLIGWAMDHIKPQPHWKPSEKQMEALKYALGEGGKFDKAALESLYEQLKKL